MLVFIISCLSVLVILTIVYLVSLAPNTKRGEKFRPFEERYIAHRGYFIKDEIPENSIKAFARAVEFGYGVELDVQLTYDKKLVVFHDDNLRRMCGIDKNIWDCTYEELQQYFLNGTNERIPLFTDALKVISGKVPLIVEIKTSEFWRETSEATALILDNYKGCYCMESFNPYIVEWFKKNRPDVIRGQLATDFFKDEPQMSFIRKFILTNLLMSNRAKPDFIAYNHKHKNQFSYKLLRKLYRVKNAAWTIRTQQELNYACDVFTCMIFDSFTPEKK